ncbi:amidohydrolase family protein [Phenylobacterium sp.]|uniref:amidohydrolase family protein n=1 Tax=Phenylobacterium sp. TaxID=1871053 RepID=UPI002ED8675C
MILRDVEVEGRCGLDVRLADGRIAEIGPRLAARGDEIDGRGGALIPGLCDHHIHLFGYAARADSVALEDARGPDDVSARIAAAAAGRAEGAWIRALGYHERIAGELSRDDLDRLAPNHPLRVQHQTGALWVLNSRALAALGEGDDPPGLDRASGRIWREDAWLRARLRAAPPPLAPVGRTLAALGIAALTDASVTTDADAAARLAEAHRTGALPQRLTLMSGGALEAPADGAFAVGPLKVLLDDHALPDLDDFVARIGRARAWGRAVAVHCVTAGELALTLAAFATAGARPGDRVEHGGVIPAAAIPQLRDLGLTVVTQSAFVRERGDRYAAEVDPAELGDLYRCASLRAAGVPVAGSSDAPYASPDPWAGMAAAVDRRSAGGAVLGAGEAVDAATALSLYLGDPADPGGPPRRVAVGETADLVLLDAPLRDVLGEPSAAHVRLTLMDGAVAHGR